MRSGKPKENKLMSTLLKLWISTALIIGSLLIPTHAKELAGVTLADEITATNNEILQLNGLGLREKLWFDIYVGALYIPKPTNVVVDILSQPGAMRIQMDIVYKEVESKKLLAAWKEGFEKNQSPERLKNLQSRIETFYSYFTESAKKNDRYVYDYIPGQGTAISKNNTLFGTIKGEDFRNALIEIWLGNFPADKSLKKGMLGR